MVRMMCPGISYSTVHTLLFHSNGSVQDNKLFTEFCNRKQAHIVFENRHITESSIDNETLTLLEDPSQLKYDASRSQIIGDYEIMRLGVNKRFKSFNK